MTEIILIVPKLGSRTGINWEEYFSGVMEMFYIMIWMCVTWINTFVKTLHIIHLYLCHSLCVNYTSVQNKNQTTKDTYNTSKSVWGHFRQGLWSRCTTLDFISSTMESPQMIFLSGMTWFYLQFKISVAAIEECIRGGHVEISRLARVYCNS